MFGHVIQFLRQFRRVLNRSTMIQISLFVLVSVLAAMVILYLVERPQNEKFSGWFECFWAAVIAVTAGYSDGFPPSSHTGMVTMIYLTLLGMGAVGTFIAWIASVFVEHRLKEGMGMGSFQRQDHIIICGWSFKAEEMIKQLRADDIKNRREVVILAGLERHPLEHLEGVHFIQGDPSREDDLRRAGIMNCHAAIVLAEISSDTRHTNLPDSRSILTILTIESLRPEVYTVAEVLDPKNIPHFRRANVDEIVSSSEFTGKLLVQATLNHGITALFEQMLTFSEGAEVYRCRVPRGLGGRSFAEIHSALFPLGFNVIGVDKDGRTLLNPRGEAPVAAENDLFVICENEPDLASLDARFAPAR